MDGVIAFTFCQRGDEPEENVWLLETPDGPESIGDADTVTLLD